MPAKKEKQNDKVVKTMLDDLKNLNNEELAKHIKNNVGEASNEVINFIHTLINN
jgi:hypothetical protein